MLSGFMAKIEQSNYQLVKSPSSEAAIHWIKQAAINGNLDAQFKMVSFSKSKVEELQWYRLAAEQGSVEAQMAIAKILGFKRIYKSNNNRFSSDSTLKSEPYLTWDDRDDFFEAMRWFRAAADQNVAEAQYWIGRNIERESQGFRSIEENEQRITKLKEAITWYRKAARQDYKDAQEALQRLGYTW
jgi:uncharacterized protein